MHIDSKMETNLSKEEASRRRYELLKTFDNMVSEAVEKQVEVIMIAGDMFDTSFNTQKKLKKHVLNTIKSTQDIDFLYLQGNHDNDNYFKELEDKPTNLKLFSNQWSSYVYGNIVISGIELSNDNQHHLYQKLMLNENQVNVVMMHGQVILGEKISKMVDISLSQLQNKYIDYLALGHIHKYMSDKLDYRGTYCYSGCLEGRGYDECGEKGYVLLDIEDGEIKQTFCPIAKRTIHEIVVDASDIEDDSALYEKVRCMLQNIPEKDYVKLVLIGKVEETVEIDIQHLEHELQEHFYTYKIEDKIDVRIDYMKYKKDVSLKGEFIRTVQEMELSEQEKSEVIRMGIRALSGEEIL